ncbi:DUF6090 family protein [Lutimonas sp.]|uniref:DUF6090 family protein n=1 Tax=Lutimonas sp. TaxID=1872403 RepID=UPI003D9BA37B
MADDNRPLKYARYAVGEIILVVIGILIALYINNWNEERKDKELLKEDLVALKLDLNENLGALNYVRESELFRFYSMEKLLTLVNASPLNIEYTEIFKKDFPYQSNWIYQKSLPTVADEEFINLAFSWSGRHVPINLITDTMEELKSTGMYSKISSVELKNALSTYYKIVESHLEEHLYTKNYFIETTWELSLLDDGITYVDVSKIDSPLQYIQNNPTRIGLLKNLTGLSQWRVQMTHESIDQLMITLELIDEEIAKL